MLLLTEGQMGRTNERKGKQVQISGAQLLGMGPGVWLCCICFYLSW